MRIGRPLPLVGLSVALAVAALAVPPVWSHETGSRPQAAKSTRARPTVVLSHTLRSGQTLGEVANRFGVTTAELAKANSITNPDRVRAGRTVTITLEWLCPVRGGAAFVDDFAYVKPNGVMHGGIDLMAKRGTPVVAPLPGRVQAVPNRLGGNAFQFYGVDGTRYYGAHLDRMAATGRVRAGAVIGYVGDTGNARGGPPHLHLEAHPGDVGLANPYPTLVRACR